MEDAVLTRQGTYPPLDVAGPAPLPAWIATYQTAMAAGNIPIIPPSALVGGRILYPPGIVAECSWTLSNCYDELDIHNGPAGVVGLAFDDGPQAPAPSLSAFLKTSGIHATRFFIGSRIVNNPQFLRDAVDEFEDHIGVHTWSHHYMTTLTDMQVLGELGWTSQIIFDETGLLPAFWRPPYGDVDERVRAIAREVFGLTTVIWDQDTFDWCLSDQVGQAPTCVAYGAGTDAQLDAKLHALYSMPKTPGLIVLQHEISQRAVDGFIRNYPFLLSQGWTTKTIPDLVGQDWYQNAANSSSHIEPGAQVGSGSSTDPADDPPASSSSSVVPASTPTLAPLPTSQLVPPPLTTNKSPSAATAVASGQPAAGAKTSSIAPARPSVLVASLLALVCLSVSL